MRVDVRAPAGELIWTPAIVVMPEGGDLEVELFNDDPYVHHAAILPSNGDKQYLNLPIHSRGTARVTLDGPGYYWFGCPVGNRIKPAPNRMNSPGGRTECAGVAGNEVQRSRCDDTMAHVHSVAPRNAVTVTIPASENVHSDPTF